jgi:hypothetical protein
VIAGPVEDRTVVWLPLLNRLSELSPSWAIRGNVEGGLAGTGDVDLVAPPEDFDAIEREFQVWARMQELGPVVSCRHVYEGLILIAVGRPGSVFYELEVRGARYFRGGRLFATDDLRGLTEMDPRGFRAVRPGAEGVLRLVLNGLGRVGRPWPRKLAAKQVPELLRADPEGARAAAHALFGPAAGAVERAARDVAADGWDRRAMLVVEGWALLKAGAAPHVLVRRTRFRMRAERCLVQRTITDEERRIPGDVGEWVARAGRDHRVYGGDQGGF